MKDDKQNGVLLAHKLANQQDQEPMQQEDDVPIELTMTAWLIKQMNQTLMMRTR